MSQIRNEGWCHCCINSIFLVFLTFCRIAFLYFCPFSLAPPQKLDIRGVGHKNGQNHPKCHKLQNSHQATFVPQWWSKRRDSHLVKVQSIDRRIETLTCSSCSSLPSWIALANMVWASKSATKGDTKMQFLLKDQQLCNTSLFVLVWSDNISPILLRSLLRCWRGSHDRFTMLQHWCSWLRFGETGRKIIWWKRFWW